MPPAALLGIGLAAGVGGSIFSQVAANKAPRALFPGLQQQGISGLSDVGGAGFAQLKSLIQTGNPVDTSQLEQSLSAVNQLQLKQNTAQLRERFGVSGLSFSSPAAVGESNLLAQNTADFMNTLSQLRYQSASDAANRELAATQFGVSSFMGPAFTDIGPKGSVVGAALSSAGQGLTSAAQILPILALLKQMQT